MIVKIYILTLALSPLFAPCNLYAMEAPPVSKPPVNQISSTNDLSRELMEAVIRATSNPDTQLASIQQLLSSGADINARDGSGITPLLMAASLGSHTVVSFLLAHSPDVPAITLYGETALHLAARYGHMKVIEVLVVNGINLNAKTFRGLTARDYAELRGHYHIVHYLVQKMF